MFFYASGLIFSADDHSGIRIPDHAGDRFFCNRQIDRNAGQAGFDQAYQEAESALKKAVEANNVWSTTEDLISEAKAAAEKKDFETAISLANRVKFESEAAYEQQTSQQKAGPTLF